MKQMQILELLKEAGQEGAEDMLVAIGWANSYSQARRLIKAAQKAAPANRGITEERTWHSSR
ncbi:hypothetical protein IPC1108_28330 [Pseudomonas aeruginosa]|uniref:hypothetical protein n=2 Tax=Pseudomonas aeruginosa TaxID=287 RepID=UPI000F86A790|nr:hypothetical protein [Pseudomonas aeruginosa]RUF39984.1 hypothetical protein IPC1108_28330 [Pseudomonas aeruginosa]